MKKNKIKYFILPMFFIMAVFLFLHKNNNYQTKSTVSSDFEKISFNEKEDSCIIDLIGDQVSPDIDLNYYRNYYQNEDIVARLEIPNQLNVLIAQAEDNNYYLRRSIDKKSNVLGTEFMDYRTDFSSKQINIYGHNSQNIDLPFHKIQSYLDENFYKENPYILLQYDGGKIVYQVFSIKKVTTVYEHMQINFLKEEWIEHLEKLRNNSIFKTDVTFDENSRILVLQTCTNQSDNSYYILSSIEIERKENK